MRRHFIYHVFVVLLYSTFSSPLIGDHTVTAGRSGQSEWQLYKLHYENSSGEKGVTTFYYDENGILHRSFWILLDGSRSGYSFHTYDRDGNMTLKYREFSDGLTSRNIFTYDQKGNLLIDKYARSDGREGAVYYSYDHNGRLQEADCRNMNGWFAGRITYEYDFSGRKVEGTISRDGKFAGTIVYKYDERDRLISEHWDLGGSWTQTFSFEYRPGRDFLKISQTYWFAQYEKLGASH